MFSAGIITVVGDILLLLGIVGIMLWLNPTLSLVTFSLLPLLIYVAFLFRRRMRSAFREVRSRLAVMNGFLAESIGGMAIVQLYNRQRDEQERFSALNAAHRDASLPAIGWDASLFALVEALSSVAIGLIIWYGGGKIVAGLLTFGALVAFIQYTEKFFTPIRDLSGKYSVMQGAMASLERIFQLLDNEEAEPQGPAADEAVVPPPLASIEFRDVSFAYRPGEPVLRSLDFAIRRGETVALVGETGGGKTTVTRLLCRLYDPDNGCILLNGIDIRHLPLQELRRRCAVVLQEPYLFSGSIADNISLGDPGAAARMEHAAIAVGADRFIRRLPGGFYEPVRERGSNFSAGERQLISFARAIAFDPELLILDEATASVDPASERLIRKGLARLLAGRTALVIAHRLTTIRHADRIIVIEGGEKVEEGGHQDLLARHGAYARLYNLQFRHGQANRSPF
jgi:ATP-binding cassette subfamily B protein